MFIIRTDYYYTTFSGLFSRTTWVSRYQKGETSLDLNEARDYGVLGWKWHQLDHIYILNTQWLSAAEMTNCLASLCSSSEE